MIKLTKKIIKYIYNLLPFKKAIFIALRSICIPPSYVYQHLYFKGKFKVNISDKKYFLMNYYGHQIENEIFWKGLKEGWEKTSMALWVNLCKDSSIIVDVGSNTGLYALVAKAINANSKVFAFEPVHRVYLKLLHNIDLNKYDIIAIEKALSNFNGYGKIYDTNSDHIYSVTINRNLNPSTTGIIETMVETITLDTFIEEYNIPKIDLLKIDVETHEPEVLMGYLKNLKLHRPSILIEVLTDEVGHRVNKIVDGLEYLYFNIDDKTGTIRQVTHITRSDGFNYLLCDNHVAKKLGLIA